MGLELKYGPGQTPLDEDEKEGLRIRSITTREELDEFEQKNIEESFQWVLSKSMKPSEIFTEKFICNLHKRMYGEVWRWAGNFRKTNKNIGVDKWEIPTELKKLVDDVDFWMDQKTYPDDEIAIRFKHRLVCIHCFPNGNGRHSRLMADIIVNKVFGRDMFSWGAANLNKKGDARSQYLKALRMADCGNFESLLTFARS